MRPILHSLVQQKQAAALDGHVPRRRQSTRSCSDECQLDVAWRQHEQRQCCTAWPTSEAAAAHRPLRSDQHPAGRFRSQCQCCSSRRCSTISISSSSSNSDDDSNGSRESASKGIIILETCSTPPIAVAQHTRVWLEAKRVRTTTTDHDMHGARTYTAQTTHGCRR